MTEDYELYRNVRNKDDYFDSWDDVSLKTLNDQLKVQIYERYLVKCEVFQRDKFVCQNIECTTPDSPITLHHIKFKKNGGKDSARNGVTICNTCHQGYHRTKRNLIFADIKELPSCIRGHTFKLQIQETKVNWKKVKAEMKKLRKEFKYKGLYTKIDWDMIAILMKWLFENKKVEK